MRLLKLRTLTTLVGVGAVGGALYLKDPRASAYQYAVMPIGRYLIPDGELAHKLTIDYLQYPCIVPRVSPRWLHLVDPGNILQTIVFGTKPRVRKLTLATPIGIAAGFDKDGKAIDSLFQLGFSWVEVGSVTPEPQEGNPKPRVFRLEDDEAIINRYGFNSEGHAKVAARLQVREHKSSKVQNEGQYLAVNLGKNKTGDEIEDYVKGVRAFGTLADALVVNVSSPNTPGLRDLQAEGKLADLLKTLVAERNALPLKELPPLLVKIAPDNGTDQIKAIARAVEASQIDGVVVSNTTIGRPPSLSSSPGLVNQTGGLSGKPLKPLALQALRQLRSELGSDVTIVGCGGISSAEDALEFAAAGADFVQLYTSFAYEGFGKPANLASDLVKQLNLDDLVWSGRVD